MDPKERSNVVGGVLDRLHLHNGNGRASLRHKLDALPTSEIVGIKRFVEDLGKEECIDEATGPRLANFMAGYLLEHMNREGLATGMEASLETARVSHGVELAAGSARDNRSSWQIYTCQACPNYDGQTDCDNCYL